MTFAPAAHKIYAVALRQHLLRRKTCRISSPGSIASSGRLPDQFDRLHGRAPRSMGFPCPCVMGRVAGSRRQRVATARQGENVTGQYPHYHEIPGRSCSLQMRRTVVEVRGEVYMRAKKSTSDGAERADGSRGETDSYVNPRNTALGSLRQLDAKITASRKAEVLRLCPGRDIEDEARRRRRSSAWCRGFSVWGFPVNPLMKRLNSVADIFAHYDEIGLKRPDLDYDIDGVVYKVDRLRAAGTSRVSFALLRARRRRTSSRRSRRWQAVARHRYPGWPHRRE